MHLGSRSLLIGAVAAVGILHTLVPDHWFPITVLARQRGWSKSEDCPRRISSWHRPRTIDSRHRKRGVDRGCNRRPPLRRLRRQGFQRRAHRLRIVDSCFRLVRAA